LCGLVSTLLLETSTGENGVSAHNLRASPHARTREFLWRYNRLIQVNKHIQQNNHELWKGNS